MAADDKKGTDRAPAVQYSFGSDYAAGAHPLVMEALLRTNPERTPGYGSDAYCVEAARLIREACFCPDASVYFMSGGTQTNAVALSALLAPYQGVAAALSGHIAGHESGAIEHGGHKVLTLPSHEGKVSAADLKALWESYELDETRDHVVMPGAVYLSQPTESGTLYSLAELEAIRQVCSESGMKLYVDGARLAYALACPANDVFLPDLARLCDAFYIGGTKCGALFGEALVFTRSAPAHFFPIMKQQGAVLAKGRLLGVQFCRLFQDGLYEAIGAHALARADLLRRGLTELGYTLLGASPTNQIFIQLQEPLYRRLIEEGFGGFWSRQPDGSYIIRFVTDWSTQEEEVRQLLDRLARG
ncbi:MAG: low specificity L-threonine aldolase [Lachnospiraceae bacterium]|nr:low specificity L-threonine aldolase [Lachnospiraceae bacterium]